MARALVPLAAGFEEMEAVILIDVLRRAGVEVVVAGIAPGPCRGSRGVVITPDIDLADVDGEFDAIVLPGGGPGTAALRADPRVLARVRDQAGAGRLTAAVCAAPTVLLDAGVLAGRRATGHPSVHEELGRGGVEVVQDRVCEDGGVVTSQSPGTTFEFAYHLVDRLCGAGTAARLDQGILARR